MQTKILICGGHLTPALAVIEEMRKRKNTAVFYVGRKHALEADKALSLEYLTMHKKGIPFHQIVPGRLQRTVSWEGVVSLCKIPIGLVQSFALLLHLQPDMVVSFGGYVALPVCFAAWTLGIPVVTHEQTAVLGLANSIISRMARVVCLSYRDTRGIAKGTRHIFTGNPSRASLLAPGQKYTIEGDSRLPVLYITGGSLGSRSINRVVTQIIPELVRQFRIVHQCGSSDNRADSFQLSAFRKSLPATIRGNYTVVEHLDPDDIGSILSQTSLLVGRSGANTVTEAGIIGIPAIFIPLPWAGGAEQYYNAKVLEDAGLARILPQKELTGEKLLSAIRAMHKPLSAYTEAKKEARSIYPADAAARIVDVVEKTLSGNV